MSKLYRFAIYGIILAAALAIAYFSGMKASFFENKSELTQEVIMEQMKNVVKLGTVEGYFSEIYNYKEHYGMDVSFFTKKALIRVKARILAGFDLEKLKISVDEKSKKVTLENIPAPQILSMEHDLDYYDITEGIFNSFSTADYNRMNSQAKNFIKNVALKSKLMGNATDQLNSHLELLRIMMKSYGWELIIQNSKLPAQNNQKQG
ncbi:MAG: DUF4230 domain-containing protein [Deltaproteobacteria bacterium]